MHHQNANETPGEKKLDGKYSKKLCVVWNKSSKQHTTNQRLYGYLRGAYDKFPDFFRMGTFIDSTHMNWSVIL